MCQQIVAPAYHSAQGGIHPPYSSSSTLVSTTTSVVNTSATSTTSPSLSPVAPSTALHPPPLVSSTDVLTHKNYFELLRLLYARSLIPSLPPPPLELGGGSGYRHRPHTEEEEEEEEPEAITKLHHDDDKIQQIKDASPSLKSSSSTSTSLGEGAFNNGYYAKFFVETRRIGKGAYGR